MHRLCHYNLLYHHCYVTVNNFVLLILLHKCQFVNCHWILKEVCFVSSVLALCVFVVLPEEVCCVDGCDCQWGATEHSKKCHQDSSTVIPKSQTGYKNLCNIVHRRASFIISLYPELSMRIILIQHIADLFIRIFRPCTVPVHTVCRFHNLVLQPVDFI